MARSSFDKKSFLNKGAIFGSGETFHLFWGEDFPSEARPSDPSVSVMDFFSKEVAWKKYENFCVLTRAELKKLFSQCEQVFDWEPEQKQNFVKMFTQTQDSIAQGVLEKLVPYTCANAKFDLDSFSIEGLIGSSLNHQKGYLYGEWKNNSGFLGLTPELLVEAQDKTISTMALAGTCSAQDFSKQPEVFLLDKKEAYEHQKVVDDLVEQLSQFGQVKVGDREVLETPKLVHLKTSLELKSFEGSIEKIVTTLHPTPALGSFPRESGSALLRQWNEIIPRGIFGAPFGFSASNTHSLFVVSIRNLIWEDGALKILTGCGVVGESQLEKEWQELQNKRESIKSIFGIV